MVDIVPAEPSIEALAERMRRNQVADRELRDALAVLGPLLRDLPATDDLLFSDISRGALRTLRDAHPDLYLIYRSAIRQKAGRHVTDLLDFYIGPPSPGPRCELRLLTVNELMAQAPTAWRVERILPQRGLGVLFGEPGSGKSFLALYLSRAIALGLPFFDRSTKAGRVIYVAAEGRNKDRMAAIMQDGTQAAEDFDLFFIEQSLDLCGQTRDLEVLEAKVAELAPAVVVIDTLARVAGGGDENSAADMGQLIASARRIEEACSGLALLVHHTGKDLTRGARGHSSLRAASDVEIEVTRSDTGVRVARVSKLRDGEDGAEFTFRLEQVALADNQSSCIVVPAPESDKPKRAERKLTPTERFCLDALREQIEANGERLPETSAIPSGRTGATIEAWRTRFYARIGESVESSARRQSFFRGKAGLLNRKIVGAWQQWAWLW